MITIHKKQTVKIEWDVYKLHSSEREDFNGALLKVFLNCNADRYNVDYTLSGNTIMVDIPHDLPIATYTLEALWGRSDSLSDIMSWDRCYCPEEFESFHSVNRSVKSDLFAITDVESEASYPDNNTVTIKVRTSVRSFGYDGMSAYEIAVMRGEWDESEVAWIHKIMDVEKPFYIGNYTGDFVVRCKPSDMQAAYEAKRMFYVYGTSIPGIPSQGVVGGGKMDIIPVQVGTNNNTYIIEFFKHYTSLVRIVLTYDKALDKFLDTKVYHVIMHSAETTKQETGESEVMVMSQKAVTEALADSEARGTKNIESLRSEIDQNLSDLERTVTANKNELDEDVLNLYEEVETVAEKVQTINIEVGHHNDDISHLQGDVRNNTNNINALGSRIDALGSVYNIQGAKASLAQLLAITSAKKGDVYSIDSEFYLAGKFYPASTNVVCVMAFTSASDNKASCWDPLGGTFNANLYLEKDKAAIVNLSDLPDSLERIEDITYTEKGKEFVSGSAVGSVLPFKLISKTTLDNGSTAWYRLALNYPTGSSNGAHQLLLQYAETTTIPTEADWKTINYINNISLSSLLSRSDVANNLTTTASGKVLDARQGKVLADAIATKQDTLVSGENIKTINNQSILGEGNITIEGGSGVADVGITGTLNVTNLNSIAAAQDLITKPYGVAFYLITDSNGKLPSKNQEAVNISAGAEKLLSFRSPNPTVNNILDQVSMDNFKPRGFNVGDIIALSRVPVGIDALVEYLGLSSAIATALKLLGLSEIEIYQYKIWATNDAKWSNFQNKDGSVVPTGVKGLMSVWDKEQVDKVPRLEANDFSTKYGYGTNFDDCLTTGVCAYSPATIDGVTENFTLIVQASSTVDSGGFYSIIQTAYGRTGSVYNRVFKRMIFYNPTTGAKEPHAWVEITENNKSTKYFTTSCAPDVIFSTLESAKVNGFAEISSETEDATRGYTFKGYFSYVPTDGSPDYMGVGMITYNDTNLSEPAIMIANPYNPTQIIGATRIADLEARIKALEDKLG